MARFSLPDYRQQVDPDRKIVKVEDYRILTDAQAAVSNLEMQLQQLREQNQDVFQQQKVAGYETGLNQAKMEQAEHMFTTTAEVVDYISSVEQTLVKIVFDAVRRIFSSFEDHDIVAHLVQKSLRQFHDQVRIRIHIAESNAGQTKERIEQMLAPVADLALLDIIESPHIDRHGCLLESEIGSVEASLETLLEAMETAIDEYFKTRQ